MQHVRQETVGFGQRRRPASAGAKQSGDDPLGDVTLPSQSAPPAAVGGLLAGRVLDSYNRKPPATTSIQIVCARNDSEPAAAPIEQYADDAGYFSIPGLKPGAKYELIARSKDGDHVLAGTTWATPPNPKLLIIISEDFATRRTPPMPPPPVFPGPGSKEAANQALQGKAPQPPKRAAELGNPTPNPALLSHQPRRRSRQRASTRAT